MSKRPLSFDPNSADSKKPFASYVPSRRGNPFKTHEKQAHATAALNYNGGREGIVYELNSSGNWVEYGRVDKGNCEKCGEEFGKRDELNVMHPGNGITLPPAELDKNIFDRKFYHNKCTANYDVELANKRYQYNRNWAIERNERVKAHAQKIGQQGQVGFVVH